MTPVAAGKHKSCYSNILFLHLSWVYIDQMVIQYTFKNCKYLSSYIDQIAIQWTTDLPNCHSTDSLKRNANRSSAIQNARLNRSSSGRVTHEIHISTLKLIRLDCRSNNVFSLIPHQRTNIKIYSKRMHSNRMLTSHSLPSSVGGGGSVEGSLSRGVSALGGGLCPVDR